MARTVWFRMREFHLLVGLSILLSVHVGCASTGPVSPETRENQWVSLTESRAALAALDKPDFVLRLEGEIVRSEIAQTLSGQQLSLGDNIAATVRSADATPTTQSLALESQVEIDHPTYSASVELRGHVSLALYGTDLMWLPSFDDIRLRETQVKGMSTAVLQPIADSLLDHNRSAINRALRKRLIAEGSHRIAIDLTLVADTDITALVAGEDGLAATQGMPTRSLIFIDQAAVYLGDGDIWGIGSIGFRPHQLLCRETQQNGDWGIVSRSLFASGVAEREPVDQLIDFADLDDLFLFTELSDRKNRDIVHAWYVDGMPTDRITLPVASDQWRTWSYKQNFPHRDRSAIVVEVQDPSGCVLDVRSIVRRSPPSFEVGEDLATQLRQHERNYRRAFFQMAANVDEELSSPRPGTWIYVRKAALAQILNELFKNPQIAVTVDAGTLESGDLSEDVVVTELPKMCQYPCDSNRDCSADRDCTPKKGCDFKWYQAYDKARCEAEKSARKLDCERLKATEKLACETEKSVERIACETGKASCTELRNQLAMLTQARGKIAKVNIDYSMGGQLRAGLEGLTFSNDLRRAELLVSYGASIDIEGNVEWVPANLLGHATCLSKWKEPIHTSLGIPWQRETRQVDLALDTGAKHRVLRVRSPSLTIRGQLTPRPLEIVFLEHPQIFANCALGVTAYSFAEVFDTAPNTFLEGHVAFDLDAIEIEIGLEPVLLTLPSGQTMSLDLADTAQSLRFSRRPG